mmetsp:Transcript_26107/g.49363  ORF Transcript_26107/g.49363 Transcript_26107/m.49363 type:complete len:84 (+) Transcript_26107:1317-1568(+)
MKATLAIFQYLALAAPKVLLIPVDVLFRMELWAKIEASEWVVEVDDWVLIPSSGAIWLVFIAEKEGRLQSRSGLFPDQVLKRL